MHTDVIKEAKWQFRVKIIEARSVHVSAQILLYIIGVALVFYLNANVLTKCLVIMSGAIYLFTQCLNLEYWRARTGVSEPYLFFPVTRNPLYHNNLRTIDKSDD